MIRSPRPAALVLALSVLLAGAPPAAGQSLPRAGDVESPEALIAAAYDALARAPGAPFQWDRFRSLFLPGARLVPNTEQTGGELRVLTPEEFITWIEGFWTGIIGTPEDLGFEEAEVHAVVERYGDIAHAMSTYEKRFWQDQRIMGRGVNSFQLVRNGGRWWIAGIVWDEENGAGPVPPRYMPGS